ncbi:aspartyl/asparaginyl beta-hydroxylase-like dioxygenase [Nitzschia inconspicua]|uniref:Aspartyl/asparaginyl beta-hydroxylase-like dioxygenase n=1 Tax=Nitzschia inconspicua TaxID=303405 RepID=A0A9K3LXT2_9STRA|nr:aspartyl/asparaginyl beta-hydroxylase-like dioxygenase [Nitzschia inconspicua]
MQFWEDVEEGLDDIESFYRKKKGQDIDRIRQFGKRARGEIPLPLGSADGHEPSEEHVDGLTAKPFWDTTTTTKEEDAELFPWAAKLEEQASIIVEEFEAKLQRDQEKLFSADSVWQNQVMGNGWSAIRLQRLGTWNSETCQEFPRTYQLLKDLNIPLAVRGVCFAKQAPGSGVQPHSDGRNFILTSHLGIQVPKENQEEAEEEGKNGSSPLCWIQVGNERRTWQVGKLLTLDTSFVHSTGNDSTEDRHVLILDFWHPELTEAERAALTFIYDLRNKFESGQVPFRKPKQILEEEQQQKQNAGGGFGGFWKSLVGGGGNDDDDDDE